MSYGHAIGGKGLRGPVNCQSAGIHLIFVSLQQLTTLPRIDPMLYFMTLFFRRF